MRDASSQVLPLPAQASTTTLHAGSRARRISEAEESGMGFRSEKLIDHRLLILACFSLYNPGGILCQNRKPHPGFGKTDQCLVQRAGRIQSIRRAIFAVAQGFVSAKVGWRDTFV
jgi:hypothetical protein